VFSLSFTELANNEMLIIACATFEAKLSGSLSQALSLTRRQNDYAKFHWVF
jgi:hypothetical protein